MSTSGYVTIQCPNCQRTLPPKMTVCQFCGASLANVARPAPVARKVAGPEPWIMTLYTILAILWMIDGCRGFFLAYRIWDFRTTAGYAGFDFLDCAYIAVGAFEVALGIGLIQKWNWARGVVNIFSWIRIALALLNLSVLVMGGFLLGPHFILLDVFFAVLALALSGAQIWVISETDSWA
jgi:hypothetical protein